MNFLLITHNGHRMLVDMDSLQGWNGSNTCILNNTFCVNVVLWALTAAFSAALIFTESHDLPTVAATGIVDPGIIFPGY
ncbi:hypothetical protein D3C85_1431660 [compost metagenome]